MSAHNNNHCLSNAMNRSFEIQLKRPLSRPNCIPAQNCGIFSAYIYYTVTDIN